MRPFIGLCLLFLIIACGTDNGAVFRSHTVDVGESVLDLPDPDVQTFGGVSYVDEDVSGTTDEGEETTTESYIDDFPFPPACVKFS